MMEEARTRKEGKKTPSRKRRIPAKKEQVAEKEQQEKMNNLMKAWSDKAKTMKSSEVTRKTGLMEIRKEPLEKQLSLVEARKRRISQVQEEVNSFEIWKRRKEEQRKHQNMTMVKVEKQEERVRDCVNRVVVTDHDMDEPEKIKFITCCNLGKGPDQVQHKHLLGGKLWNM